MSNYRLALLVSVLLIIPIGYFVRFYQGGQTWVSDFLGSVAYEIFWIVLVGLFFPAVSPARAAIGVCLATCMLEFLQLWHPPFLEAMRATFLGRMVLGTTFNWADFLSYFAGSAAGWGWMRSLRQWAR